MADTNFKAGDCVELKHGGEGTKMTIQSINKDSYGRMKAYCSFWDKSKQEFKHESFTLEALKICSDTQ